LIVAGGHYGVGNNRVGCIAGESKQVVYNGGFIECQVRNVAIGWFEIDTAKADFYGINIVDRGIGNRKRGS
jgi:hypothetical protein